MPKKNLIAYPFVIAPVISTGKSTFALTAAGMLVIRTDLRLLHALLPLCDGNNSLIDIKKKLKSRWPAGDIQRMIDHLHDSGILADADTAFLNWWTYVENPRKLGKNPSPQQIRKLLSRTSKRAKKRSGLRYHEPRPSALGAILKQRHSTRRFGDKPVPLQTMLGLVWAAYGIRHSDARGPSAEDASRTVPSAGGIAPLRIAFINLKPVPGLTAGTYRVHYSADGKVALEPSSPDTEYLFRCFIDPNLLRSAQGVMLFIGAPGDSAEKYGNRSALYAALEAGHAVQNALLAAAGYRLAAVEIGGFYEAEIRQMLSLPADCIPLSSIVFGNPEPASARAAPQSASPDTFRWVEFASPALAPAFCIGLAQSTAHPDDGNLCWGRDRVPLRAHDKAMAEAVERRACGKPSGLYRARYRDMDRVLDPRGIVAYQPFQYRAAGFPYAPFNDRARYWWKDGIEYLGRQAPVAVLADLVYFADALPARSRQKPYTAATTSGVAAHRSPEQAVENATLELLERDAFMRAWLGDRRGPRITLNSMPAATRAQIRSLSSLGFQVVARNIAQDMVPVVLVMVRSRTHGITAVAAASHYDPEAALNHALMEVESSIRIRLDSDLSASIAPEAVSTPADHGNLYAQRRYYRKADALLAGTGTVRLADTAIKSVRTWNDLTRRLARQKQRLVVIDLTPQQAGLDDGRIPLFVARVISPGLIPISFGYGTEPRALPAVVSLYRNNPGFPTGKPWFPHPFP